MLLDIWPYKLFAVSVFVVQDLSVSALCLFGSKVPGIWELSFPLYLFFFSFFFPPLFFNPSLVSLTFGSEKLMSLEAVNAQDVPLPAGDG